MKFATGFLYYCGILFERRTGMKKLIAAAVLSLSAVISGSAAAEWSVEEAAGKVQAKADEAGRKIETEKSRQEALDAEAKAKREAKAGRSQGKIRRTKRKNPEKAGCQKCRSGPEAGSGRSQTRGAEKIHRKCKKQSGRFEKISGRRVRN